MSFAEVFNVFHGSEHSVAVRIPPGRAVIINGLKRERVNASDMRHLRQVNINMVEVVNVDVS